MQTQWLSDEELTAWVRLIAVVELLPGVLDSQLTRDAELTHFEYFALSQLSESPDQTLRTTALAQQTNATVPRLSHVARRLEGRGLIVRFPCPDDARATNIRLTETGMTKIKASAPGHVAVVRERVLDALTPSQISQLSKIAGSILTKLDPDGAMAATWEVPNRVKGAASQL
ncbi:MarR family winged helix-turn-helix transcriptional regulator [Williamsia soli]|uniref:MarR family winged helix-turn-helix transcriptional regulator n=1 Tax=Williamsia soli TaxID=364929 RepID=UPI001A9D7050|nr:MarR family transcriptional regulator [Williamsia soli]